MGSMMLHAVLFAGLSVLLLPSPATAACVVSPKPPSTSSCGIVTYVRPNSGDQFVSSFDKCVAYAATALEQRDISNQDPFSQYSVIAYNSSLGFCSFSGGSVTPANNTVRTIQYLFPDCFDCSLPTCNNSPQTNLLFNAGFNQSKALIGPFFNFGNNFTIIPHTKDSKAISWAIDTQTRFAQFLGLCNATMYRTSIDVKVDRIGNPSSRTDNIQVQLEVGDSLSKLVFNSNDPDLGKWRTIQFSMVRDPGFFNGPGDTFTLFMSPSTSSSLPEWRVTVANPRVHRMPSRLLKTKGRSLVRNGGFETGRRAPWSLFGTTGFEYYSYYPGRLSPCTGNDSTSDDNGPEYEIQSPGLPKTIATPASKFKFRFCGMPEEFGQLHFDQNITATLDRTKVYVVGAQYRVIPSSFLIFNMGNLLELGFDYFHTDDTPPSNETRYYQRLFSGTGETNFTLQGYLTKVVGDPSQFMEVFLDNISLRELDE